MQNPLDVFFGPAAVVLLQRRGPSAIVRAADRVKPLLLGAVHPDANPGLGAQSATEIAEAFFCLAAASKEEVNDWVQAFVRVHRFDELKAQLRDALARNSRLEQRVGAQETQIKELTQKLVGDDSDSHIKI